MTATQPGSSTLVARPPRRRIRDAIAMVLLLIGIILPLVPVVLWSIAGTWRFPSVLPTSYSTRSWAYVLDPSTGVLAAFLTSVTISSIVALIAGLIGLSAGRALGLHSFRGKRLVYFLLLAPEIIPPLTVAMGNQVAFIKIGLADTIFGVILVQLVPTIPYVTLVMSAVYSNFDVNHEHQARVLGASPLRAFWHVTLPAIFPGFVVALLFAFLISWSEYIMTLLIGGGIVQTLPLILFSFAGTDLGIASALSVLCLIPAFVIIVASSRYLSGERATLGGFGRL
jgi:putative spermidine/putrescine transport system permease protein